MDKLPHHILTNVLEVISVANKSLDGEMVGQKALNAMFQAISAEGGIFFLPDENGQFTHIILKNLEKEYCNYYKTYYHRFDPLQLADDSNARKGLAHLDRVTSYNSFQHTEFYNDFLKPQKINYKLIVNMFAEDKLYGKIVLTRPRKSKQFSQRDIRTAKTISPYLAHALAHNELRKKIRVRGSILDYIENQSSVGMILLDDGLNVIYQNRKAEQICGKFKGSGSSVNHTAPIVCQFLKDCRKIKTGLKDCPAGGTNVPRHSVVKGPENTRFLLISKILDEGPDCEGSRMFMVSIQEKSLPNFDPQFLIDTFRLSKREIDVVALLFLGMRNAQIAGKLFVTEITIKKHLHNIYGKVGVNNRTKLINKILTR
jgi:DNA-binding CsgD family transcriptional regulator